MFLQVSSRPIKSLSDRALRPYDPSYKSTVLFFALIDQIFALVLSLPTQPASEAEWPNTLAEWIRNNDDALIKAMGKVLRTFQVQNRHKTQSKSGQEIYFLLFILG